MNCIGRYQLSGELGKGAMGVVYRAVDPNIGRPVALKTMRVDLHGADADEMLQRFKHEARAAGALNHPNIVTIYDAGESEGLFYIAMEFIEGRTVQQLLTGHRPLPVDQVLSIVRQVGAGLDYAHERGIVHRDVKPANIMITSSGLVKIMDFGIAKADGSMTSTGQVLGTPNYMAPEQVKGQAVDGRTDLFSLGVIAYEMLTGEKPFGAQNVTTIIYKIVNEEPTPPRELDVSIHPGLSAAVTRALAKRPDDRFRTVAEFARELDNYKAFGSDGDATIAMAASAEPASAVAPVPQVIPQHASPSNGSTTVVDVAADRTQIEPIAASAPAADPTIGGTTIRRRRRASRKVFIGLAFALIVIAAGFVALMRTAQPMVDPPIESAQQPAAMKPAPVAPAKVGVAAITSTPAAASIKVDGKPAGKTPLEKELTPGVHSIEVSAAGYAPLLKDVEVTAGTRVAAEFALTATVGIFRVESDPEAADILLDGKPTGKKTPADFELDKGDHVFAIRLEGYDEAGDLLESVPGQTTTLSVTLNQKKSGNALKRMFGATDRGQLTIFTDPAGADVYINGKKIQQPTPVKTQLPVGAYRIALRHAGYRPVQSEVEIEKNKAADITETLRKRAD